MHTKNAGISRNVVVAGLALLALVLAGPVVAQEETPPIDVEPQDFAWVDVDQEAGVASYEWSAKVANRDATDHEVDVVLQLLDTQDSVQHEETVRVQVGAQGTEEIESGGSIELEVAQEVVQLRHQVKMAN